jgi:hypothetical protein
MDGREEFRILKKCWREKKKKHGEEEREIQSEKWKKWKDQCKRKMDVCRAE